MSSNSDVIVIFPIYGKFGAIWKPNSGPIACKTYISIKSIFYLTKTENLYHSSHTIALSKGVNFAKKR